MLPRNFPKFDSFLVNAAPKSAGLSWMPFLQAYAVLGNANRVVEIGA